MGALVKRSAPALFLDPVRRRQTADLHVGREADADQPPLRARLLLLAAQIGVADLLERQVERPGVLTRVVRHQAQARRLVGEVLRRYEVLAAHLGRIHLQLGRQQIHHALDQVGGLGAAGATVGVDHRRVGVDTVGLVEDVGDLVAAADHAPEQRGHDAGGAGGGVRTQVSD